MAKETSTETAAPRLPPSGVAVAVVVESGITWTEPPEFTVMAEVLLPDVPETLPAPLVTAAPVKLTLPVNSNTTWKSPFAPRSEPDGPDWCGSF